MTYDFTSILERHGMDALAVDPPEDSVYRKGIVLKDGLDHIPMWVADMNFPACPSVIKAMEERVKHPAYGYFLPREEYYDAIIRWQEKRNGVKGLTKECIGYENGVLGGVVSALRVFCGQSDKVLLHSPTYVGFTGVLENNGIAAVHSRLLRDAHGIWRMNYEEMDRILREEKIHAAVFCSPHNPTGRVWERQEIEQAMEIFRKNEVFVISDEIWSDILLDGHCHIPTQSVSEDARNRTVAFYAPSKTFNLAGLVGSYHIIYDRLLRDRVEKQSSLCGYNSMNVLSMAALIGAYSDEGERWADELKETLSGNIAFACDFIRDRLPFLDLARPQGTYLLYLDASEWLRKKGIDMDTLLRQGYACGVDWQDGRPFLMDNTIRMNLALPLTRVQEAFHRLENDVFC